MRRRRGAVVRAVAVALALVADACGGGGAQGGGAGVGGGAGRAAGSAGGGASGGGGVGAATDAAAGDKPDLATDFGGPTPEVAVHRPAGAGPAAAGALAPAAAELVIDDFNGTGRLDGRQRSGGAFTVKEQFDATASATFEPAPAIEASCGAAAPGAAHVARRAADTGATFALVFSSPGA